jgi:hypothetical protein
LSKLGFDLAREPLIKGLQQVAAVRMKEKEYDAKLPSENSNCSDICNLCRLKINITRCAGFGSPGCTVGAKERRTVGRQSQK